MCAHFFNFTARNIHTSKSRWSVFIFLVGLSTLSSSELSGALLDDILAANLGDIWLEPSPPRERPILTTLTHLTRNPVEHGIQQTTFISAITDRKKVFGDLLSAPLIEKFFGKALRGELEKLTLWSEQAGILLSGAYKRNNISLRCDVPILASFAHFYADEETRANMPEVFVKSLYPFLSGLEILSEEVIQDLLEGNSEFFSESQQERLADIVVAIEKDFGIADIRLEAAYTHLFEMANQLKVTLGAEAIIPSEKIFGRLNPKVDFKHGKGSTENFDADTVNFINMLTDPDLAFRYLSRLIRLCRAIGLPNKIGTNDLHAGIYAKADCLLAPKLHAFCSLHLHHTFAHHEYRLLRAYDPSDTSRVLVEPQERLAHVQSGNMFRAIAGVDRILGDLWTFGFGGEFFAQEREKIDDTVAINENVRTLQTTHSSMPESTQQRLFMTLRRKFFTKDVMIGEHAGDIILSAGGTLGKSGIGRNWHLGIGASLHF